MPKARAHNTFHMAHAAAALALLHVGCATTANIAPDQLPIVTAAAARDEAEIVEVTSVDASTVRMEGRLDGVSIGMAGWGEAMDRFDAPVSARMTGPWLIVQDQGKGRVYALSQITGVRVHRYNSSGAVSGGAVMTAFAAAFAVGGTILVGVAGPADSAIAVIFGPQMIALGIGLGAGGIPLIVAGKRKNERLPPGMPEPRPRASLEAGPGGVLLRF